MDTSKDTLEEMSETQLTDYLFSMHTLTRKYRKQKSDSICQYFPHKDKRDLDPGE
jgi:hypothetical protein